MVTWLNMVTEENIVEAESFRIAYIRYTPPRLRLLVVKKLLPTSTRRRAVLSTKWRYALWNISVNAPMSSLKLLVEGEAILDWVIRFIYDINSQRAYEHIFWRCGIFLISASASRRAHYLEVWNSYDICFRETTSSYRVIFKKRNQQYLVLKNEYD